MAEQVEAELLIADQLMKKAEQVFAKDLSTIRTGRASPSLIEDMHVEYYGASTPMKHLATISVPEARLLTIQPWDPQSIKAIEKSFQQSDLGLTPTNDGTIIRLAIPALNEERRRELVKLVRKKSEDGRVVIRNIRRESLEKLRLMEKNKQISADEFHRAQDRLQKQTDTHIIEIDTLGNNKELEVMEV